MDTRQISYQQVAIKYGILVGAAHIMYFLLMHLLDLQHIIELSFLSGIFLIIGIVLAISQNKKTNQGIWYFADLTIGAITGFVSSLMMGFALVFYVTVIDPTYLQYLSASGLFPEGISVLYMFLVAIFHGTWPGFFIGFISMQWFKRQDHSMNEGI
jgi:hypothetical protein